MPGRFLVHNQGMGLETEGQGVSERGHSHERRLGAARASSCILLAVVQNVGLL